MSILDIIKPIELLSGSHEDAGKTGRGCLMNVVSYLNGDRKITDHPACACEVITPIAIFLNDFMNDSERHQLLPFVARISGSRTSDPEVLSQRAWACVRFAEWCRDEAAESAAWVACAESAAWVACAESAASAAWAESAACAACAASAASAAWAESAAWVAYEAYRQRCIARCLQLLDEMCPPAEETDVMVERAQKYAALTA